MIIATRNVRIRWRPQTNTMPVETKGPLLCFGVFVVQNIETKLKTQSFENYWRKKLNKKEGTGPIFDQTYLMGSG